MKLCNCGDKHVRHGMPVCLDGNDLFYQICPKCKGKVEQIKFNKKKEITEEWIEEKAIELNNEILLGSWRKDYYIMCKDFIRSLIGEIRGK